MIIIIVACSNQAGSRNHFIFLEQILNGRCKLRCCLTWRAIVFYSVLSFKKPNIFTKKRSK